MLKEFKEFISKGNIVDLAIGVIIGAAFGKIVSSLVNDIIMPIIGLILGKINFKTLSLVLKPAEGDTEALTLNYGMFIQNIVDFLIIAFVLFMVLKIMLKFLEKNEISFSDNTLINIVRYFLDENWNCPEKLKNKVLSIIEGRMNPVLNCFYQEIKNSRDQNKYFFNI